MWVGAERKSPWSDFTIEDRNGGNMGDRAVDGLRERDHWKGRQRIGVRLRRFQAQRERLGCAEIAADPHCRQPGNAFGFGQPGTSEAIFEFVYLTTDLRGRREIGTLLSSPG